MVTLKAARVNAGISQVEAAKLFGITQKTLSSYERGKQFPTAPTIKKMIDTYNVKFEDIKFFLPDESS